MDTPTEVTITISERCFSVELPIDNEIVITNVFLGLGRYVQKGFPIKVRQAYKTFSGTQEIITKVISNPEQLVEWGRETKRIISSLPKI